MLEVHEKVRSAGQIEAALQRLARASGDHEQFDSLCERVSMAILGKRKDPSPGVDWHVNRSYRVNHFRQLVRDALLQELARHD